MLKYHHCYLNSPRTNGHAFLLGTEYIYIAPIIREIGNIKTYWTVR